MDNQTLMQLNRRIEEHHQGLCGRLEDLTGAIQAIHAVLLARMDAHEAYHAKFEHRWGLIKLAERYPFRLAMLTFATAWALLASAPGSARWMGQLAQRLLRLFFS
jgi:hypothetical protein